jgi:hypothetical protein
VFELKPEDVVFFRYAADELQKIDLELTVERMPAAYDDKYMLLVEPGYTAPLPHSFVRRDDD